MRGTLEFKLPKEEKQFLIASNSQNIVFIMNEFSRELRNLIKYSTDDKDPDLPGLVKAQEIFLKKIEDEELLTLIFD